MQKAKFYQPAKLNKVQCQLCHNACIINNGQVGVCQARKNINGALYSLVYGYPAAMNIDPIEKKPFFHFQPGTTAYSLGTLGCNFKCANCQNWDISQAKAIERKTSQLELVAPEKIVQEAIGNNCSSIAYTYNEPTIFAEYALAIMKLAHQYNLKNVWVSNGFMSRECLDAIAPYLDAINIDLKSMSPDFYRENCHGQLRPVLDNLKLLKRESVHIEITSLIIPTLTDDVENFERSAGFIANELDCDTPWHISCFSPAISWRLKNLPATDASTIYQAYEIGKNAGLKYVYTGNIPGDQKENTYCPACGRLAIRRLGYEVERFDKKGCCSYCDKNLDIVE